MIGTRVLQALIMTTLAGLSTGIGGAIGIFAKRSNTRFLSFALGLSVGVMVYISFIEMMPESAKLLMASYGEKNGLLIQLISFFAGMLFIALIDKLVPSEDNPHEAENWDVVCEHCDKQSKSLEKTGILTALAIAVHNFPEGMASFVSAMRDSSVGIAILVAIAIHNIPEGMAAAAPIYYGTGNKKKAFLYSLLSGLAEPLGALVVWLVMGPYMSDKLYGMLYAAISGIMIFISFDELLPSAQTYGAHHISLTGVVIGMVLMAVSLLMFM
ncbi:MAG: zinc transporter ZupT [Eubacteriales bacterium]|nr:zinc transporter ZupT [Eubacteriales bacterium]